MRVILLSLLLSFVSCGDKPSKDLTGNANVLRMQLSETPETLDPRLARSLNAHTITKMLFDGLTRLDTTGKAVPSVAERVDVSDDGLIYTFLLRDTYWSDGFPVTAYDFEYAWKSILSPDTPAPGAAMLYCIHGAQAAREGIAPADEIGIAAVDSRTLRIMLDKPIPYFCELTAYPTFFPVPRHADKKSEAWSSPNRRRFICNGPFTLDCCKPNSEVSVVRNPHYWDTESVNLDGIYMPVIPDEQTALYLYQKGDLDWVGSPLGTLPAELVPELRKKGQVNAYTAAATLWYKLNTDHPPFNNTKVRRALALAIDRQALIDHVVPLGQSPATSPVPPLMGLSTVPAFVDGDTLSARQLFEEGLYELGLTHEQLAPITLLAGNSGRYQKLAQAIQDQWRSALGIEVKIEATEFKILLTRMRHHDYDIAGKIWFADFNDPTGFLSLFKYRDDPVTGGLNETGWHDPEFTRLLNLAENEADPARRRRYLQRAESIFVDQMPVIPIYYHTQCYLKNESITSVALPPAGTPDFKWTAIG